MSSACMRHPHVPIWRANAGQQRLPMFCLVRTSKWDPMPTRCGSILRPRRSAAIMRGSLSQCLILACTSVEKTSHQTARKAFHPDLVYKRPLFKAFAVVFGHIRAKHPESQSGITASGGQTPSFSYQVDVSSLPWLVIQAED